MIESVYQKNNLEVNVDDTPIGGYRGSIGTLTIHHVDRKVYTDWEQEDLQDLAELIQTILKIQESHAIHNTLIMARQEERQEFKLSLVPYPKCNISEKIQGFWHFVFGVSQLPNDQLQEIQTFYNKEFKRNWDQDHLPESGVQLADAFCTDQIIKDQRIVHKDLSDRHYDILQDNRPRIVQEGDAHILIVPTGESGHQEGSQVSVEQRVDMLMLIQKTMNNFLRQDFKTLLFLERNGPQLRSLPHKHAHVHGIQTFPQSFWEKIRFALSQIFVKKLSSNELEKRIEMYQGYQWN